MLIPTELAIATAMLVSLVSLNKEQALVPSRSCTALLHLLMSLFPSYLWSCFKSQRLALRHISLSWELPVPVKGGEGRGGSDGSLF